MMGLASMLGLRSYITPPSDTRIAQGVEIYMRGGGGDMGWVGGGEGSGSEGEEGEARFGVG